MLSLSAVALMWLMTMVHASVLQPVKKYSSITSIQNAILNRDILAAKNLLSMPSQNQSTVYQRSLVFTITETCRKSKQYDSVMPLLQSLEQSVSIFEDDLMPLLNTCAKECRTSTMIQLFAYLAERNARLSAASYSVVLKGLSKIKNTNEFEHVVKNLVPQHVKPDGILLNSVLNGYFECGLANKAFTLFSGLIRDDSLYLPHDRSSAGSVDQLVAYFAYNGIQPNRYTFNIILKGLRNDPKAPLEQCFLLLNIMQRRGLSPDAVTINTLIDACSVAGDFQRAQQLLLEYSVIVGVEGYGSILYGLANSGNIDEAFQLLDRMLEVPIAPNEYVLTALMSACIRQRQFSRASELLRRNARYARRFSAEQMTTLYNTYVAGLFGAYCSYQLDENTSQPTRDIQYRLLLQAQLGFIEMAKRGMKIDVLTINALLSALTRMSPMRLKEAMMWVRWMPTAGIAPTDYTYTILLPALGKAGFGSAALDLFRNITRDRVVDTPTVNALFKGLLESDLPADIISLYLNMTDSSSNITSSTRSAMQMITPNRISYTILFLALMKLQAQSNRQTIRYNQPKRYVHPTIDEKNLMLRGSILAGLVGLDSFKNSFHALIREMGLLEPDMIPADEDRVAGTLAYDDDEGRLYEVDDGSQKDQVYSFWGKRYASVEQLFNHVYAEMRSAYNIVPDEYLVSVINSLFYNMRGTFSKKTARSVFEDLLLLGYHPSQIEAITETCRYSNTQVDEYRKEEVLTRLRKSTNSYRIFKRHGWNAVESGWTRFF